MKIKKIKSKKYSLLELTLKKFQLYKKNSINNLEIKLKQIFYIIVNYHLRKKKILFIGLPYTSSRNHFLVKRSKHTFITTNSAISYFHNPTKLKNISLIVFFNSKLKDTNILKELRLIKKPLIILGQHVCVNHKLIGEYVINFNMEFKPLKQFCAFLIYSIIKKF